MIEALANRWGHVASDTGKTVWAELAPPTDAAALPTLIGAGRSAGGRGLPFGAADVTSGGRADRVRPPDFRIAAGPRGITSRVTSRSAGRGSGRASRVTPAGADRVPVVCWSGVPAWAEVWVPIMTRLGEGPRGHGAFHG
jgi:hypothetical protein